MGQLLEDGDFYASNKYWCKDCCRKDARSRKNVSYHKVRIQAIEKLGGGCIICGFDDIRALQIDHVNGNGAEERRKFDTRKTENPGGNYHIYKRVLGSPEDYQILCANHNKIKQIVENEHAKARYK